MLSRIWFSFILKTRILFVLNVELMNLNNIKFNQHRKSERLEMLTSKNIFQLGFLIGQE